MADNTGQSIPVAVADPGEPAAKATSSPWEEDLDIPDEPAKKPMITGSLDSGSVSKPTPEQSKPFSVPGNIEEKVGQKVPAAQYMETNAASSGSAVQSRTAVVQPASATAPALPALPANKKVIDAIKPAGDETKAIGSGPLPVDPEDSFIASQAADTAIKQEPKPEALPKIKGRISLSKLPSVKSLPIFIITGIMFLLISLSVLTEYGVLSLGLEKVYGAISLERLWGGLGKSAKEAIFLTGLNMKQHSSFKASGTIALTIDKSVKSPVTSPLVAKNALPLFFSDERIAAIVKGIELALYEDTTSIYDYSTYDYGNDTPESIYGTSSGISDDSTSATSPSSSTPAASSQSDYPSYQYQGATTKEIPADVDAVFGSAGGKADFKIKKVTGEYNLSLISLGEKLLLKSDKEIKYGKTAGTDKWLEYMISPLKNTIPQKEIFAFNPSAGFSVKGGRVGSERIGKTLTYRYRIENMELGNSLSSLGITSDMIQSINGDVWVGVKDKLVRRVSIKIVPAPSASVTSILVDLDFSNYDMDNMIESPATTDIVPGSTTTTSTSDDVRKTHLEAIQDALESYKEINGAYPVANSIVRLNTAGNPLAKVLIPQYISALSVDPKSSEGWYYGYKSDGADFTLSARLEDVTDSEGISIGDGVVLYYLYNK